MQGFPRFLIGAAALSLAGTCAVQAATPDVHTMLVNLPDGSVAQVQYQGKVAPRISIQPVAVARSADTLEETVPDAFARMAMVSAMMDRQADAMMQQVAMLQHEAAAHAPGTQPGMTITGMTGLPQGMHMTYVSTTTDADGCTRTISYSSDGEGHAAPRVTQAASDGCHAAGTVDQSGPSKAEADHKV
jgi:hypothetical protein